MSDTLYHAFHFDSLVWHGPIAIYLFLLGMSAGAALIGLILKRWVITGAAWENGFIRAVAIIAPAGILISLGILINHLTKPLMFWKLMLHYNLTSVMSVGVLLFQIYTIVLFIWLALVFHEPMNSFLRTFWKGKLSWATPILNTILSVLKRLEVSVEVFLAFLAVSVGVYTGFLLSALKTYPMLNNPWLPLLFLFSAVSSGVGSSMLLGVIGFKESANGKAVHWLHKFEKPIIFGELVVLGIFFAWLVMAGGRSEAAAINAIGSGFWAGIFWLGIVGLGLLTPLALQSLTPDSVQSKKGFVLAITLSSLLGVFMLRYFILYAGQMTVF